MEMKNNYAKITFKNLSVDYDYTIQPWSEVGEYINMVQDEFELLSEEDFEAAKEINGLPEFKIGAVQMTDSEYNNWFVKNIKP